MLFQSGPRRAFEAARAGLELSFPGKRAILIGAGALAAAFFIHAVSRQAAEEHTGAQEERYPIYRPPAPAWRQAEIPSRRSREPCSNGIFTEKEMTCAEFLSQRIGFR